MSTNAGMNKTEIYANKYAPQTAEVPDGVLGPFSCVTCDSASRSLLLSCAESLDTATSASTSGGVPGMLLPPTSDVCSSCSSDRGGEEARDRGGEDARDRGGEDSRDSDAGKSSDGEGER